MLYRIEVLDNNKNIGGLFTSINKVLSGKNLDNADHYDLNLLVSKIEYMLKKPSAKIYSDSAVKAYFSEKGYEKVKEYIEPIESILWDYDCELLVRTQESIDTILYADDMQVIGK